MKHTKLLALLLSAAFVAGCAGMNQGSSSESGQRSTGQVVDDAAITAKVKTALLADPEISGLGINVDTSQGAVRLKGEVKSVAHFQKAGSIAEGVAGVRSVDNQIIVCMTCK
ncbi:BON domain-containing protein [Noviherbaspirillum sp.]|uniref:BON domain-containing protein n=1 Tax=Noviherbaspirillum sp. TaxID=1926288 RepID=UPI0039C8FE4C